MRSGYGKAPYTMVEGTSLRSKISLFAKLEVSHVPCENNRNPLQSFAWNMFHNDGIIIFYGSEARLVRFWSNNGNVDTKPQDNHKPITPQTWTEPPTQFSFEVRTPTNERVLHAKVVAVLFGPSKIWCKASGPTFDGQISRAEYQSLDLVALAHQFSMSGTTIVCAHANQLKQTSLIESVEPTAPLHQRLIMAGVNVGSKAFVAALIEADELLHHEPISAQQKIQLLGANNETGTRDGPQKVSGLLHVDDAINEAQEQTIRDELNEDTIDMDNHTRRKLKQFGFQFDSKGHNVQPSTPIPEYLAVAHHIAAQLPLRNGLPHELNQCTVAVHEPRVGVGDHKENQALGDVVLTFGLQGAVPVVFTPPHGTGAQPITVYHKPRSILAMTAECIKEWKHGIPAQIQDEVQGEVMKREQCTALIFHRVPSVPAAACLVSVCQHGRDRTFCKEPECIAKATGSCPTNSKLVILLKYV